MSYMINSCKSCGEEFEIFDEDMDFYKKISLVFSGEKFLIPPPTHCPDCRQQRRVTWRNERNFYRRKCDKTGEMMVSVYDEEFPGKVFGFEAWWGDDWDPMDFGRDFDFERGFFDQFIEMSLDVPRPCIVNMSSENSMYTNHSAYNKNCYMCINTGYSEDLLYCSNYNLYNKDCTDCLAVHKCERCYFCVNTKESSFSKYLSECKGCTDCSFCFDCKSCQNCFGCFNLRSKEFCIYNEQYSKEEYEKKIIEVMPVTWKEYAEMSDKFRAVVSENAIFKSVEKENCKDSSGDHIWNNKNVKDSYYVFGSEDCRYCYDSAELKNCYDALEPFKGELQYETHGCNIGYGVKFCSKCYEDNDTIYSQYCWYCSDCFGCFGLRHKKFCIFNKQYTKEQYEELVPKIIAKMIKTGEWGEFFPSSYSPFAYNETTANEYYPLSREQVIKKGLRWKDDLDDVKEASGEGIIKCEVSGRPFRLVEKEKKFYEKMGLPLPGRHPDQRHLERMSLRNPRKLWERECMECGKKVDSVFSPDRTEKVYCEKCYLESVY